MNAIKKTRDKASDPHLEELAAIERELSHLSAEELWKEFRSGLTSVTKHTKRMAVCVKMLRDQGVPLTGITNVQTWIRIAEGRVLPELISSFAGSLNRDVIERLPLADQRKLVEDPMVEVAQKTEQGFTKQRVDLRFAPRKIAEQVVSYEGLRAVDEQLSVVALQAVKPIAPKPAEDDTDEPLEHSVTSRYTATQLKHMRINAAESGVSVSELQRRMMIRSGMAGAPKRKRERV